MPRLSAVGILGLQAEEDVKPEQEASLQWMLIDKTPDQLKLQYSLWTRAAVQQLIKQETELNIETASGSLMSKRPMIFAPSTDVRDAILNALPARNP